MSTIEEWFAHPVGGPLLQAALVPPADMGPLDETMQAMIHADARQGDRRLRPGSASTARRWTPWWPRSPPADAGTRRENGSSPTQGGTRLRLAQLGHSADGPGPRCWPRLDSAGVWLDPGLSDDELADVERRFGFTFCADHRDDADARGAGRRPLAGLARRGRGGRSSKQLAWPVDGVVHDVLQNEFWPASWGPRPDRRLEAEARRHLAAVPTMVPVYAHRYLPSGPGARRERPVFSIYQTDVISLRLRPGGLPGHASSSVGRRPSLCRTPRSGSRSGPTSWTASTRRTCDVHPVAERRSVGQERARTARAGPPPCPGGSSGVSAASSHWICMPSITATVRRAAVSGSMPGRRRPSSRQRSNSVVVRARTGGSGPGSTRARGGRGRWPRRRASRTARRSRGGRRCAR